MARVELVEKILSFDAKSALAGVEGPEQDARSQSSFPKAGLPDKDHRFSLLDEIELGEFVD